MKKYLLWLLLTLCFTDNVYAVQNCQLPEYVRSWDYWSSEAIRSGKDWKNDSVKTDYWKLSLSWSGAYCDKISGKKKGSKKSAHQCKKNRFGLVTHGLWAQSASAGKNYKKHPRNCRDTAAIDKRTIKQYLCVIPDNKLMQKQWEKHGTCDFLTPEQYLKQTANLYNQLILPTISQLKRLEHKRPAKIRKAFVKLNRDSGMTKDNVWVQMKRGRLSEIHICYDLDFKLTACQ